MNSVSSIQTLSSEGTLSEGTKSILKTVGPHRPDLKVEVIENSKTSKKKSCISKFRREFYKSAEWLCGCRLKNTLFCYICLVMDRKCQHSHQQDEEDEDEDWVTNGVPTDFANLVELTMKVDRHERNPTHMCNSLGYALLGKLQVTEKLSKDHFLEIRTHNDKVRQRRHTLSKLVDCVLFGSYENFPQEMKKVLESEPDQSFKKLSNTIDSNLLKSVHSVYLYLIRKEIEETSYVSLQVDEVGGSQLTIILRYELNGQILERFLGVLTPESQQPQIIALYILSRLKTLNLDRNPEKVISQSYDGVSGVSTKKIGIQFKIKEMYKNAELMHSYSHNLDLILERVSLRYREVKIFFAEIDSVSSFFSNEKCIAALGKIRLGRSEWDFVQWNFQSECIQTVHKHKEDIINCLIFLSRVKTDKSILGKAVILKKLLMDRNFNYWLELFSRILPHCVELFKQLRQNDLIVLNHRQVLKYVEICKSCIKCSELEVELKFNYLKEDPPPEKRLCLGEVTVKEEITIEEHDVLSVKLEKEDSDEEIRRDRNGGPATKVCDLIIEYINDRFSMHNYFSIAALVQPSFFKRYKVLFPKEDVLLATSAFGLSHDAFNSLQQELKVLYRRTEFCQSGAVMLLRYFYENSLIETFPETTKLLKSICTMPIATCEPGRCFETLVDVKRFLRGVREGDDVGVSAVCFLEKELMQTAPDFNNMVVENFCCTMEVGEDFTYK